MAPPESIADSALVARKHPDGVPARLLRPYFARVTVAPEAAERLSEAHQKGIVVHVLRSKRVIDPLFILYALGRLGLPKPAWMHDHLASQYPPTAQALREVVARGESALLFLRRPVTVLSPSSSYSERHVETLLGLQRQLSRPILLMPETLSWTKRAVGLRKTIIDAIFGDREAPGRLRELIGFLWQHDGARYHVGAPVNLAAVLEREGGKADHVIAKKIRWSILHHLSREEALRTGPVYRTAARTRQMVVNDGTVRRMIADRASRGEDPRAMEKKASEMVREIAADLRYGWIRVLDVVIDKIWNRIYDGIIVDSAGLERVRNAARRGPVVMVPSHKSHIDYLVLSQVFFKEGLMPPHVAAGENLNFWPVGTIFRRAGAFFIRRAFKGDKFYSTVFAAYVRRLLKEGHAVEFFIEGGRSRTGKLLAPKMGMLSMCAEPVFDGTLTDVSFIPVSISYEKIIEARSYARELGGGEKKKEDARALISTAGVLLSRYGRVYVDFDEPISMRVFAASRGIELKTKEAVRDPAVEESSAERSLVTQLGHRIVYGINRVTRVTPTSLAALMLLSRTRRGMAENELYARAERWITFLTELGARKSNSLAAETARATIKQAIVRLANDRVVEIKSSPDGDTIFRVEDMGRLALDYYKNNILHMLVPHAIVAVAVLAGVDGVTGEDAKVPDAVVLTRARDISRVLKHEFSFRPDDFESNFRMAANGLIQGRMLQHDDAGWSVTRNGATEVVELAGMIATFFEAYRAALEIMVEELASGPVVEKKLAQRALLKARRYVLEGRILRAEGASQLTMGTAIQLFIELGIFGRGDGGNVMLTQKTRAAELTTKLDRWLAPLKS